MAKQLIDIEERAILAHGDEFARLAAGIQSDYQPGQSPLMDIISQAKLDVSALKAGIDALERIKGADKRGFGAFWGRDEALGLTD
eukprot:8191159-Pyramimonas_sp.AAC.1